MAANADRNLLFGILALQNNFISREQLLAAFNAWVVAKDKTLGEILLEQKAVDSDTHVLLDASPHAAPALLAAFEPACSEVLPRSSAMGADVDWPEARLRRDRAAHTLFPDEPALMKDWLYAWLRQTNDSCKMFLQP